MLHDPDLIPVRFNYLRSCTRLSLKASTLLAVLYYTCLHKPAMKTAYNTSDCFKGEHYRQTDRTLYGTFFPTSFVALNIAVALHSNQECTCTLYTIHLNKKRKNNTCLR